MYSRFSMRILLAVWFAVLVVLGVYSMGSGVWARYHLPFMKVFADTRDTINVAPYIYGKTPLVSLGEIKKPNNAYIHLKLRFRADSTEGHPNVFQTAPVNRGMRMEIAGSTAAIIVPDLAVPGGVRGLTLTTDLKTGQWYALEVEALNGAFVHATLDGHLVADFASAGLSMETSQILIGGGFDASRAFLGQIENISLTKGNIADPALEKFSADSRETKNVAPYINGKTPVVSLGGIKSPNIAYVNLKLRFRADSTEGNPNVFQTAPVNRGMRMEISGSTAAIIVPDLSVPGGLKGLTLTTALQAGRWYTLEVGALNGSFVHATLDGHLVADYVSTGLSMETSQILIGGGFDESRIFRGQIDNISVIKGNPPLVLQKIRGILYAFYTVLLTGIFVLLVKFFGAYKTVFTFILCHPRFGEYIRKLLLVVWMVALVMLGVYSMGAGVLARYHLPFIRVSVDNRDTINVSPYIYGETPLVSLGEIKKSDNAYINLKLQFRADSTDGNPNVFQTAPVNRGIRMEISGSTATIIVPDLAVPGGVRGLTLTTALKTGQWYALEVEALNGAFIHATLDGHLVNDYASTGLSIETSQLLVGGVLGFEPSRAFHGKIENIVITKGNIANSPSEAITADNRKTINVAPYIYGKSPSVVSGEIKNPENSYVNLKLRFRADSTEGNPNVFQTAPVNRGMRMEISGSTAAIIIPDLSVPGGLKGLTLTTALQTGQWYTLEVGALNGSFVHAILDGHLVADYASAGLSMETSQILVGGGFDESRVFHGQIDDISVIKGNPPSVLHKSRGILYAFYAVLLTGLAILLTKYFLKKKELVTYSVIRHKWATYTSITMLSIGAGFIYYIYYLMVNGYLPSPFVWSKSETLMDLFNPMYWAYNDGRYTDWGAIYPPLSFLILRLINFVFSGSGNGSAAVMRDNSPLVIAGFILIYLAVPAAVLKTKLWQGLPINEKILIYFATILSTPMLFALERGNLIVLCPILLALALSKIGFVRCLCIALLINIKPYFALLMIYHIARKNWKAFTTSVVLSGFIFVISGFVLDSQFLIFFENLLGFSQSKGMFSFKEVMALPSSISAFSYVLKNPEGSSIASGFLTTELSTITAYIIEAAKWIVIAISLVTLFTRSKVMRDVDIFTLLVVITTNLGVWVGGYSLIFYIVLIPVLIKLHRNWIYIGLLAVMAMPLDIIPLSSNFIGQQYSYLTNSYVDVQWSLGLGSVIRPIANLTLLLMLSLEFLTRKDKASTAISFICKIGSKTKEKFPWIFAVSKLHIGLTAVLLVIFLYNSIYFNKYFPITEGWFSAYSHLIRQGLIPYRDFYLFLTPLYPLQLAGFQAVFGESFIALRMLGIVIVLLISLFLYLILVRRFSPLVSAIATITGIVYYQSGVAHITYDFIQFFTLYVLAATYLLSRYSDKESVDKFGVNRNAFPLLFIAGIMVSLAFLTKQSNGTLVVLFSILAVIWATASQNRIHQLKNILIYMSGMALPVILIGIWLYFSSALKPFMNQVFYGAIASKGSMWHILFSWMNLANKDFFNQLLIVLLYLSPLFTLSLIGSVLVKYRKINSAEQINTKDIPGIFLFFVLFCGVILISYYGRQLFIPSTVAPSRELANYVIVVVSTTSVAILMLSLLVRSLAGFSHRDRDLAVIATMAIGLVFGNGTSAGLSEVSAFLGFAFALAYLMSLPNVYGIVKAVVGVVCLSFVLFLSNAKFRQPYAWWNISVPDVRESTSHPVLPLLTGFLLSPDTTKVLEEITQIIQAHSSPKNDVFTFPNIPGFYVLANRWPHSKVVVSWFDFLPDMPARVEAQRLLDSPPAIIVNLKLPEDAWTAHERLFREGKPLGQRDIQAAIWELTEGRKLYQLDFAREVSPGSILEVWHYRFSKK